MKGKSIMENENKVNVNVGGGFLGLLTIAFIILKLCKVITWSWVWVLCPLWAGFALAIVILIITAIIVAIANR